MNTAIKKDSNFLSAVNTLLQLTKRNMKLFLKDKATVFFSLLAPLILVLLYVLFLSEVQIQQVMSLIPQSFKVGEKDIKAYVDCWMIAGVLSVSCITVSLSANSIMIQDKERGILNDALCAPVKRSVITFSYFLFNLLVTLCIVCIVFAVCLIFIACTGGWYFSFIDILGALGIIIFSALSSTLITVFVCNYIKTQSALGAIVGIMSAAIGFLIGVYMPMSIMPKAAQYISALIPGSHSAGLFKSFIMSGALENLAAQLPAEVITAIASAFDMKINFFGSAVGTNVMSIYLAASIFIFFILNYVFSFNKKVSNKILTITSSKKSKSSKKS